MKYTSSVLKKAEKLLDEAEYIVRYEKGNFHSGYCILEEKKVVVVNKYFETEAKVSTLIDIIASLKIDTSKLSEQSKEFYLKIAQLKMDQF
ncbi:MAG: hypothetical protein H6579_03450 [Chitinophagales bacterium]|nr:hypothetical protein [Bacteroidota bacterium]MCB9256165.1 hypothetical protein [Chitinophagales bacterium]